MIEKSIRFGWDDIIGVQSIPAVMVVRLLFGEYLTLANRRRGEILPALSVWL